MKSSKNGSFIFSVSCNLLEFADLLHIYILHGKHQAWYGCFLVCLKKKNFVVYLQEISDTYSLQLAEIFMLVLS